MVGACLGWLEVNELSSMLEIFSSGGAYSASIRQNSGFKSQDVQILDYLSDVS